MKLNCSTIITRPSVPREVTGEIICAGNGESTATLPGVQRPKAPRPGPVLHFELTAPQAHVVSLVGSFNHWDPKATPMRRSPGGKWSRDLALTANHDYGFVVDGQWLPDPKPGDNGMVGQDQLMKPGSVARTPCVRGEPIEPEHADEASEFPHGLALGPGE